MRKTTEPQDHDPYHRRLSRLRAVEAQPTLDEVVRRAKAYVEDQAWLSPVDLMATIKRLVDAVEAQPSKPAVVEPAPNKQPLKAPKATAVAAPTPTHRGTVLGLKGREDYEAMLVLCDAAHWLDQHGRRFSVSDYGYDAEETYRLDLDSLKAL